MNNSIAGESVVCKENIVLDKSYAFALRIIKLYSYLSKDKKEFVLSKQILRSGTSIGANDRRSCWRSI
jgi:four helix bundle protein